MLELVNPRPLPNVLVIDDDMVSREVLATVLTMSGYQIHTAPDGSKAVEMLCAGECKTDVILMDAQMPGLSGTRLVSQIRIYTTARVFIMSASRPPEDLVAAADGLLLKPFGPEELRALLEEDEEEPGRGMQSGLNTDVPVVKPETLARLREMMPSSAVRQLYQAIVADLGRRQTALEDAIAKQDSAEVRRIGHAIKGGCGMAGALQAARLGQMLEEGLLERTGRGSHKRNAAINHLGDSTSILGHLRAAAQNLERMLEAEFPV